MYRKLVSVLKSNRPIVVIYKDESPFNIAFVSFGQAFVNGGLYIVSDGTQRVANKGFFCPKKYIRTLFENAQKNKVPIDSVRLTTYRESIRLLRNKSIRRHLNIGQSKLCTVEKKGNKKAAVFLGDLVDEDGNMKSLKEYRFKFIVVGNQNYIGTGTFLFLIYSQNNITGVWGVPADISMPEF